MNEARFWRHVALSDDSEDACWVWTGSQNCYGRGRFSLKGKIVLAHRIAFEIVRGAVPQGYRLVQTCANPNCIRHWRLDRPIRMVPADDIEKIRHSQLDSRILAERYQVSTRLIRYIRAKRT